MIGTPYLALGGAIAIVAAGTGGYFHGRNVERGDQAEKALSDLQGSLKQRDATQQRIGELEASAAAREGVRQETVREITREIPKIIRDPVYRNVCITDDGVRLIDRSRAAASSDSGAPAGEAGPSAGHSPDGGPGDGQADSQR